MIPGLFASSSERPPTVTGRRAHRLLFVTFAAAVAALPPAGADSAAPLPVPVAPSAATAGVAERVLGSVELPLAELATEVLERNPELARSRAAAAAAELRAPQVRALPDPMATLTAFLATPETRVGPQQVAVAVSQRLPWFGKLALREQEALYRAAGAAAEVEAKRLALVTETRRLAYELAFLDAQEVEVRADRATLAHYEELARARYASGSGIEQAVVKLQAEITKDDNRLLDIASRRASLLAALNGLRDRPAGTPLPSAALPVPLELPELQVETTVELARQNRPELDRARAGLAAARAATELAQRERRPDVTLGLGYTVVGRRDDPAGRATPPHGNGDDILGLSVGVNLPIWRQRIDAGVEEAAARQLAAEEELRATTTTIDQSLDDLVARLPLIRQQLDLFDDLLLVQAEEALRSAETAYAAGTVRALDLLDAERLLLEVRVAAARSLADYWITLARLEGAAGVPVAEIARRHTP